MINGHRRTPIREVNRIRQQRLAEACQRRDIENFTIALMRRGKTADEIERLSDQLLELKDRRHD